MAQKKKTDIPMPADLAEAGVWLEEIGDCARQIADITSAMNADIAEITSVAGEQALPFTERRDAKTAGLHAFAEAHRTELTNDGRRKSIEVPSGTFGWRLGKPKVTVPKGKMAAIVAWLIENKLDEYVRRPDPELNRQKVHENPDAVRGVPELRVSHPRDKFFVSPRGISDKVMGKSSPKKKSTKKSAKKATKRAKK